MSLSWQEGLFAEDLGAAQDVPDRAPDGVRGREKDDVPDGGGSAGLDLSALHRVRLDDRSWLDVARGAYADHGALFDLLLEFAPWQRRGRRMYDRDVLEPRLVAAWAGDDLAALPEPVDRARRTLSARYGVDLDSVLVNLYAALGAAAARLTARAAARRPPVVRSDRPPSGPCTS